eukprot:161280-Pelagomonas_calceolata.AAC.1
MNQADIRGLAKFMPECLQCCDCHILFMFSCLEATRKLSSLAGLSAFAWPSILPAARGQHIVSLYYMPTPLCYLNNFIQSSTSHPHLSTSKTA